MAPGIPPTASSDTAICYSTALPVTVYVSNYSFTYPRYFKPTFYQLRMFQRELGRYIEKTYAEMLRQLNYRPSIDGVRTKKDRCNLLMTQIRSLWCRQVHFDLRQPCWRAGRWRSLTA